MGVKKCAGCLKAYFCTRECQLAHWTVQKTECRQITDTTASKTKQGSYRYGDVSGAFKRIDKFVGNWALIEPHIYNTCMH
jgi:hypothetical protein